MKRTLGGWTGAVLLATVTATAAADAPAPEAAALCPRLGWGEFLPSFLKAKTVFPTDDTPIGAVDCQFHQWSWEAFVWATALDAHGVPRFLGLPTIGDLTRGRSVAGPRTLTLATRGLHGRGGAIEGTGAIVEADGNMLVAANGYPVYASVHMNDSYFDTVRRNRVVTGDYERNPDSDYFGVGAAVFKATWLRLEPGQAAPDGAFVTKAQVPVLTTFLTADNTLYVAPDGATVTVDVALLGLHVVGQTINHPEFLWATFEHKDNSPRFKDGTFDPTSGASDPRSYTLYRGGTPYDRANQPSTQTTASSTSTASPLSAPGTTVTTTTTLVAAPAFTFDPKTQKFSPVSNAVLANRTGGETFSPAGPANIDAVNAAAHTVLQQQSPPQRRFANYDLIGTVWMQPGTFGLTSNQSTAVGSVNLANVTAETFVQNFTGTTTPSTVGNCFSCHNATTFQDVAPMPNLKARRIAISHVTAAGSLYAVPNLLSVNPPLPPAVAPAQTP
ncbi:hypothetical protein [Tahibacter caeni]|uniref:hypothetical protein n=1 Tax=Tahibacter caeni TaxID=1453545 RepID=UPI002148551C|nr:hypothetical protein [Tahibacter caeni]